MTHAYINKLNGSDFIVHSQTLIVTVNSYIIFYIQMTSVMGKYVGEGIRVILSFHAIYIMEP
jgi:hypothetical protein